MTLIYSVDTFGAIEEKPEARIGGKGLTLLKLSKAGIPVPKTICIATSGYNLFVEENRLREKINLELHRKELKEMRWEEIWDIALRIQNLFLTGTIPEKLYSEITNGVQEHFGDIPLAVRSSAPDEDSTNRSFAGLHESYINVIGIDELFKKIKKVWASLWSDRAILYRQELNLHIERSTMAVVVQQFLEGEASGVLFTKNPLAPSTMIVEAVHGLNQGLVDGDIEPDRWVFSRMGSGELQHSAPTHRDFYFVRSPETGVQRQKREVERQTPPLTEKQVAEIAAQGLALEKFFGSSQDIEWTVVKQQLYILQSRPITTADVGDPEDKRSWYLSLNRSYENLLQLWKTITEEQLPRMDRDSDMLSKTELDNMSDSELADELQRRSAINDHWVKIYWSDFIPFAHGARLFGELYNDVMEPGDPFEFVALLTGQNMLSTDRNYILYDCAAMARSDDSLRLALEQGRIEDIDNYRFHENLRRLQADFSMAGVAAGDKKTTNRLLSAVIVQYALLETLPESKKQGDPRLLESRYLQKSTGRLPVDPVELLSLARASYTLRDNDNIHIGRIHQELQRAAVAARSRMLRRGIEVGAEAPIGQLSALLRGENLAEKNQPVSVATRQHDDASKVYARQILGQPASRGIAKGLARVIESGVEMMDFQKGEILVIDAIDPTLTFFAPLAAGIIERRGGMLIHGAIIAREYGIPCITGVSDATLYIRTGDTVTVDAYLGICTVQRRGR